MVYAIFASMLLTGQPAIFDVSQQNALKLLYKLSKTSVSKYSIFPICTTSFTMFESTFDFDVPMFDAW